MDRRYQVFVSSTYQDLVEERLEVIKALLELDCIPCGMEYFPAASEETWTYIQTLITDCDYYVLIVGGRYGSLTPEGVSYTEREYEFALNKGVPTIAFIRAKLDELPVKKSEQSTPARKKLESFIQKVRTHLCKDWETADQLGAVVSRSLTQLIKRHPRSGWVKADALASGEATEEILRLTKKVSHLEAELTSAQAKAPEGSGSLAQGNDRLTVRFTYGVIDPSKNWNDPKKHLGQYSDEIELTWDQIYGRISPIVSMRARETSVKNAIIRLIDDRYRYNLGRFGKRAELRGTSLAEETLHTIKIQLIALGLVKIEKKGEKSPVLEWSLTKLGEERMFNMLSVKRSGEKPKTKRQRSKA